MTLGYYDALEAATSIEDMAEDEENRNILRWLKLENGNYSGLWLTSSTETGYHPGSSAELGWLGHFAMKSSHLEHLGVSGRNIFENCSKQSVDRLFEDLGKCNHIKSVCFDEIDPADIILFFFRAFGYRSLEELYIHNDYSDRGMAGLDDDVMAECVPSLAACSCMRKLELRELNLGTKSSIALSAVLPRMVALIELELGGNLIDDQSVEVLVSGLVNCKHLHELDLGGNRIGDGGLEVLIEGLPANVHCLNLPHNEIALARQLPLLRFKELNLSGNVLSPGGAGVLAASLTNPECRLEELSLYQTSIGDREAAILATSLRRNQRLTTLAFPERRITERGFNAFLPILCDTASVNATHGSNHTIQDLGVDVRNISLVVKRMLRLNADRNKRRVAAAKILQIHHHLLLDKLPHMILPHLIAWLERFADSRLDLKLSAIFEFLRAMPMAVVFAVDGKKKGTKRKGHGRFRLNLNMVLTLEFVRAMAVNIVDGMTGNDKKRKRNST